MLIGDQVLKIVDNELNRPLNCDWKTGPTSKTAATS